MRYIKFLEVENFKNFGGLFNFDKFEVLKYYIFDHYHRGNLDIIMDAMSFILCSDLTKTHRLSDLINRNESEKSMLATASVTLCCCTGITADDNNGEMKFTRTICKDGHGTFQINKTVVMKKDFVKQLRMMGLMVADNYGLMLEGAAVLFSLKSRQQQTQIFEVMGGLSAWELMERCEQLRSDIDEQEGKVIPANVDQDYLCELFHCQKWKLEFEKRVEKISETVRELEENDRKKFNELKNKKIELKVVEEKLTYEELNVRIQKERHAQIHAGLKLREEKLKSTKDRVAQAKSAYGDQQSMINKLYQGTKEREAQISQIETCENTMPESYDNLRNHANSTLSGFYQHLKQLQQEKSTEQSQCESAIAEIEASEAALLEQAKINLEKERKRLNDELDQSTGMTGNKRKLREVEPTANKKTANQDRIFSNEKYGDKIEENKTFENSRDKMDVVNAEIAKIEGDIIRTEDDIFETFCRARGVKNIREFEASSFIENKENSVKTIELGKEVSQMKRRIGYERSYNLKFEEMKVAEKHLLFSEKHFHFFSNKERKEYEELSQSLRDFEVTKMRRNALKTEIAYAESALNEYNRKIADFEARREKAKLDIEKIRERRHLVLIKCKEEGFPFVFTRGNWNDVNYCTKIVDGNYGKEDSITFDFSSLEPKLKQLIPTYEILGPIFDQFENIVQQAQTAGKSNRQSLRLELENIKSERLRLFMNIFQHVAGATDKIYKDLTNCGNATATLIVENSNEPYLDGIRYEFAAPGKGQQQMNDMPIEERYVAAMALLTAIQSYKNDV